MKGIFVNADDSYKLIIIVLLLIKIGDDIMKNIVKEIFYGNLRPNDDINKYAEKEVQEMLSTERKLISLLLFVLTEYLMIPVYI